MCVVTHSFNVQQLKLKEKEGGREGGREREREREILRGRQRIIYLKSEHKKLNAQYIGIKI